MKAGIVFSPDCLLVCNCDHLLRWCIVVKLAMWEALLSEYVLSIEWVLQVLTVYSVPLLKLKVQLTMPYFCGAYTWLLSSCLRLMSL